MMESKDGKEFEKLLEGKEKEIKKTQKSILENAVSKIDVLLKGDKDNKALQKAKEVLKDVDTDSLEQKNISFYVELRKLLHEYTDLFSNDDDFIKNFKSVASAIGMNDDVDDKDEKKKEFIEKLEKLIKKYESNLKKKKEEEENGLSGLAIGLIIAAVVLFVSIIGAVAFILIKKKKDQQLFEEDDNEQTGLLRGNSNNSDYYFSNSNNKVEENNAAEIV